MSFVDEDTLKVAFAIGAVGLQPKKLEGERTFDDIGGLFYGLSLRSESHHFLFVSAKSQAFI